MSWALCERFARQNEMGRSRLTWLPEGLPTCAVLGALQAAASRGPYSDRGRQARFEYLPMRGGLASGPAPDALR